jgi:hypothetical protein
MSGRILLFQILALAMGVVCTLMDTGSAQVSIWCAAAFVIAFLRPRTPPRSDADQHEGKTS